MEDRWFGNEFQILGATDENDLEVAMVVLRGGIGFACKCWFLPCGQVLGRPTEKYYR